MTTAAEIVRVLREAGGKLDGRAIHARGSFHDLEATLSALQEHSKPDGFIVREKPGNSSTFVYGLKLGAKLPIGIQDELAATDPAPSPETKPPARPPASSPATSDRSAKRLHEHLFKTLEDLEAGTIDHVQAKARAVVADQIIKLANTQLLYAQLKAAQQIGEIENMPLIGNSEK